MWCVALAFAAGCGNCGKRGGDDGTGLASDDGDGTAKSVIFPNTFVGQTSQPKQVTITNTGPAPLAISGTSFSGANVKRVTFTRRDHEPK